MNNEQESEIKRLGLIEIVPCKEEKRDERGNLIGHKYPYGNAEEWKYDDRNNIIWYKNPDGTTEEWKYDDRNNIIWHKTPDEIYYIDNKEYRKVISLDK